MAGADPQNDDISLHPPPLPLVTRQDTEIAELTSILLGYPSLHTSTHKLLQAVPVPPKRQADRQSLT